MHAGEVDHVPRRRQPRPVSLPDAVLLRHRLQQRRRQLRRVLRGGARVLGRLVGPRGAASRTAARAAGRRDGCVRRVATHARRRRHEALPPGEPHPQHRAGELHAVLPPTVIGIHLRPDRRVHEHQQRVAGGRPRRQSRGAELRLVC